MLSGCSNDNRLGHTPAYNETKDSISEFNSESQKAESKLKSSVSTLLPVILQSGVVQDFYVDTTPVRTYKEQVLPSIFQQSIDVNFTSDSEDSINETLTSFILSATGIPIDILQDENKQSDKSESEESGNEDPLSQPGVESASDNPNFPGAPEVPGYEDSTMVKDNNDEKLVEINFSFSGSLKELIDKIASRSDLKWTYNEDKNTITMSMLSSMTFIVPIKPHSSTDTVSVTTAGGVSSDEQTSGSTSYSTSSNSSSDPWKTITTDIKGMLSKLGTVSINQEAGIVRVSDKPVILARVSEYINQTIDIYNAQLLVDVRIIHLSNVKSDSKNINWATVNSKIGSIAATANFGVSSLTPAALLFNYQKDPAANTNNISAAIDLLSKYSESYTVDAFSAVTSNFRSVPIQISGSTVYFKPESEDSESAGGTTTSSTSYTAEEKKLGTTITLTPSMINDTINLSYVFNKSSLKEMKKDPNGNDYPIIDSKTFVQTVSLKNSIPMVVSAVNLESGTNNSSSPLDTGLWFMGGSQTNTNSKEKDVILITVSKIKSDFDKTSSNYYDDNIRDINDYIKDSIK
jgi:type IVB pilus formation R64 PilN family outer membrane protein